MRTHRTHEILPPWSTGTPVLDAARLGAVRIEPVFRARKPALALDIYLADEHDDTIVPLVLVDLAAVIDRDRDPLIWPHGTPGDDAFALAVADRILPQLERLILCGEPVAEQVVRFSDVPRFEAARAAKCFGAAPLREALARLAPYRYARRFARGRCVWIDAPDAIGGWALLKPVANAGVAAARRDPAALAWYGTPLPAAGRADVAIVAHDAGPNAAGDAACVLRLDGACDAASRVDIVDPLPLDVGIVFDPAEGPLRRWFSVECNPQPAPRALPSLAYQPAGGSAGRIAVVLGRADGKIRPSADTDEADALVAALGREGFDARLIDSPEELGATDLVHLIGAHDGRRARAAGETARRSGVPVAVHAYDDDAAHGGWWGAAVTRSCFESGGDERDVVTALGLLARRAVAIGAARADVPFAPDEAAVEHARAALRDAALVFAATAEEADGIRERTGRRGPIAIVPPLAPVASPASIGRLVGPDPFALIHAPIGLPANQLMVARCAALAGIPLVLAGPVTDGSYLERIREFGGPGLVLLPGEPAPGVAAALRAAAAVVVDASWVGEGGSRLAAAALSGARLALAERCRFEAPGVQPRRFDPADSRALTRALGEAWDDALRAPLHVAPETLAALAPEVAVRAIVRGYAELAALPVAYITGFDVNQDATKR